MQFTFASNAATLIGGCLINFKYKLRLPVAFLNAFIISVRLRMFVCVSMLDRDVRIDIVGQSHVGVYGVYNSHPLVNSLTPI